MQHCASESVVILNIGVALILCRDKYDCYTQQCYKQEINIELVIFLTQHGQMFELGTFYFCSPS